MATRLYPEGFEKTLKLNRVENEIMLITKNTRYVQGLNSCSYLSHGIGLAIIRMQTLANVSAKRKTQIIQKVIDIHRMKSSFLTLCCTDQTRRRCLLGLPVVHSWDRHRQCKQ